ncbi:MAG: hypothetical protein EPO08_09745 [Rhodospirillaceae bacterium]|nr:MAG: hypothetical protein EPO08_09745 [Rhodospirillaceae bacterium]
MFRPRLAVVASMILAAALTRLLPHPPDMTSIAAVALFGGAYFSDKRMAFLVPFAALFMSDLLLGFYAHMEVVYGSFALITCIGLWLQARRTPVRIAAATLAGSAVFFLVTNFGVWAFGSLYPKTMDGLVACYIAAIPFFANTLQGDVLYTFALFGGFALLERQFAALREAAAFSPRPA